MDESKRQRAKRGTIGARYLLALPVDLAERVAAGALAEGVSVAEWIRRACERAARSQSR